MSVVEQLWDRDNSSKWDLVNHAPEFILDELEGASAVVIGCGHSGTLYIAKVFQEAGLDVGHEYMDSQGTSDSRLTPLVFPERRSYTILHQVRHPLNAIIDMQTVLSRVWVRLAHHIPLKDGDPMVLQCMKYWYYWNLIAESKADFRYRVEDIEGSWVKVCRSIGLPPDTEFPELSPNTHKKPGGRIYYTWDDMIQIDRGLALNIVSMASRYGYELEGV